MKCNKFGKKDPFQSNQAHFNLKTTDSEEEVRLFVLDQLGISKKLKVIGNTDGIWSDRLFEFKHDKKFNTNNTWRKSAFQALAQGLYYCRKILNSEVRQINHLPHSMIFIDKNGGFIVSTKPYEWILQFDPIDYLSHSESTTDEQTRKIYDDLIENNFNWEMPPSRQNPALVNILMKAKSLQTVLYFDFSKKSQFQAFLESIKISKNEIPQITITNNNFISIFDLWFESFAPKNARRRDWADRYIFDLRKNFELNERTGDLTFESDTFKVSVSKYKAFWQLYKRPPVATVDEFINTNKDLLYDVKDQNNYGDFYTPLRLVKLARSAITRRLPVEKTQTWWDPAAGGGNLFFRFSRPHKSILTTVFKEDADGLKGNSAVRGDIIEQVDFINDLIEKDLFYQDLWKKISQVIDASDELVFFLNPPFDDQAESGGTHISVTDHFLDNKNREKVTKRSLRSLHTRFLYRIMSISRRVNKPVWVATFSKVGWIVGPDSVSFYRAWSKNFDFIDGFIIPSTLFNGVKQKWPCLFSIWKFNPKKSNFDTHLDAHVFNPKYEWIGIKTLNAFNEERKQLSKIAKLTATTLGKRRDYITVAPLKNEYEVSEIVYDDKLPKEAIGYMSMTGNDVYSSQKRVVYLSSIFGSSNHNGTPILKENFESAMMIYGIRKSVSKTWLNDKDEFYLPVVQDSRYEDLRRKSVVYSLIEGGYASSLENIKYKKETYEFRNEFFIPSTIELRRWGAEDIPERNSYAHEWIQSSSNFSPIELNALHAAKDLIRFSFKNGERSNGDPRRQLHRGDAGIRQLINGLLDFEWEGVSQELKSAYTEYLNRKKELRREIEILVYSLNILNEFTPTSNDEQYPLDDHG